MPYRVHRSDQPVQECGLFDLREGSSEAEYKVAADGSEVFSCLLEVLIFGHE